MNTNKILNISSDYNIKILFSYLEYNSIIKVIKYNKFIQNKLYIKIDYNNYVIKKTINKNKKDELNKLYDSNRKLLINTIALIFFVFFYCIISIIIELFCFSKLFEIITKIIVSNYFFFYSDKKYFCFIATSIIIPFLIKDKNLYKCLFFSFIRFFPPFFVEFFFLPNKIEYDSAQKILMKVFFSIIIYSFSFIYDFYLRKKIKNDFHNIVSSILKLYIYLYYIQILFFYKDYIYFFINYKFEFYILEYKKIKIEDYFLQNYENENNKENYIKDNCKNFKNKRSTEELEIINKINNFRRNNNIKELLDDNTFPLFLINKQSEILLFPYKKIFKSLNDNKYICKINEKDEDFINDNEIKTILLKDYLNRINVIKQNDIIYILLF